MSNNPKNASNLTKVAILGHRGIPSSYGGFETLAAELSVRLVDLGCIVTAYCRSNYFKEQPAKYRGVDLVYLKTVNQKFLDTPYHSLKSVLHMVFKHTADVVIVVNVGNAPFAGLAKLFGKRVIFCVDGLDWKRKKWNKFASWYLKTCSYFAKLVSHVVVTDAVSVQDFYKNVRGIESVLIPYGTDIESGTSDDVQYLDELGLKTKNYFIYVARFEPENNPLLVVQAHAASKSTLPLVMVGDNRYNPEFVAQIKAAANDKVIFLGYVFGAQYKQLVKNSLAYVRAAEVGGISPAVIEAMGRGACVIANDKSENREALSDTGLFFNLNINELSNIFAEVTAHPEKAQELGRHSAARAMLVYSWDKIAFDYLKLIRNNQDTVITDNKKGKGKTKKVMITGAGGMLGASMYEYFSKNNVVLATTAHATQDWQTQLDVTNFDAYEKLVKEFLPDYILHLPAMTNLEECEKKMAQAYAVNAQSVKYAAQLATRFGAKLVYISSSNVFDGSKEYYSDLDEPNPNNVYGLTKHIGALMAQYYAKDYLIIRLGWLIGGGPVKDKKFVAKIVEQIVAGKRELHALTDKSGSVSYTRDVAKNLDLLLEKNAHGTFNMASTGFTTRYEVAKEVVKILGYEKLVKVTPVDSSFFSHTFSTARSASECLVNDRLNQEKLSLMRPWQESLNDYLQQDFKFAFYEKLEGELKIKTVAA